MTKHKGLMTVSILSLSTVGGVAALITGILPQLRAEFPGISQTLIDWLVTVANLSALVTMLANRQLVARFGRRRIVVIGLLTAGLAGVAPIWLEGFWPIMVSRIVLGLGIGLYSPNAITLIVHTYHGPLQTRLLGFQTGLGALGIAFFVGLAALIINVDWHAIYWLYLLLLPLAALAHFVLPAEESGDTNHQVTASTHLPAAKRALLIVTFITFVIVWGVQLKLPVLFDLRQWGDAATASWTLAVMNIGGGIAGLTFGWLYQRLHQYTLVLGYVGALMSVLVLFLSPSVQVGIAAAIGFIFVYSYTGPYLVSTSNQGLDSALVDTMGSWLSIAMVVSAFFAPLFWNWIGQFGPASETENALIWMMVSLGLLALGSIGVALSTCRQKRAD